MERSELFYHSLGATADIVSHVCLTMEYEDVKLMHVLTSDLTNDE
jgi:hypothetical protein